MFGKKKKKQGGKPEASGIKPLKYSPKIMLAWGEAIMGNREIRDWLIKNGYRELGLFSFALRNKEDAREWLMKNGYPHLMAMINAIEGNKIALDWLKKYKFTILEKMALAADGNNDAFKWLIRNGYKDFAMIAKKIEFVKDEIQRDHDDVHKISPD